MPSCIYWFHEQFPPVFSLSASWSEIIVLSAAHLFCLFASRVFFKDRNAVVVVCRAPLSFAAWRGSFQPPPAAQPDIMFPERGIPDSRSSSPVALVLGSLSLTLTRPVDPETGSLNTKRSIRFQTYQHFLKFVLSVFCVSHIRTIKP